MPASARCVRSFTGREGATLTAVCSRMTSGDTAQPAQALAPGYFRDRPVVDLSGLKLERPRQPGAILLID